MTPRSKYPSIYGPPGPHILGYLDRGVQILGGPTIVRHRDTTILLRDDEERTPRELSCPVVPTSRWRQKRITRRMAFIFHLRSQAHPSPYFVFARGRKKYQAVLGN